MRHLLGLLVLLMVGLAHGADTLDTTSPGSVTIPPNVAMMVQQADADVMKAHATLLLKLRKEQDVATRKGNLELAMWLKARVQFLQDNPTLGTTGMVWDVDVAKAAGEHSSRDVIFYTEPDFKGQATIVRTALNSIMEVGMISFPNDGLRSIKVPDGYAVTVYEADFGGGASQVITHDMPEFTTPAALGMTSFRISKSRDH